MPLTPVERKAALVLKEVSYVEIADELGVTRQHISEVVRGERRSVRVEEAIARTLGMDVSEVFPALTPDEADAA